MLNIETLLEIDGALVELSDDIDLSPDRFIVYGHLKLYSDGDELFNESADYLIHDINGLWHQLIAAAAELHTHREKGSYELKFYLSESPYELEIVRSNDRVDIILNETIRKQQSTLTRVNTGYEDFINSVRVNGINYINFIESKSKSPAPSGVKLNIKALESI